jgi:prepilin-type N-terminal cleavage/methylation domain-containing protein
VRRRAFTLIEVMAVVMILGLLVGATVWLMVDDARRASRADAVGRLAQADRLARLAAKRLGAPCVLRCDLDAQRVRRIVRAEGGREEVSHAVRLPPGCRIAEITLPEGPRRSTRARRTRAGRTVDAGAVDIAYSTAGRSPTYALRLVCEDGRGRRTDAEGEEHADGWLVVAGLTGQVMVVQDEEEIDNLFRTLARGRPDAR